MLTIQDFDTHLYQEIIAVISRENNTLLQKAIDSAEEEAKSYLVRFDIDSLFNQTGADRHATLMMYLKDMAVWHFIPVGNPSIDVEYRKDRYHDAMRWLTKIQSGKNTPVGWTLANEQTQQPSVIQVSSNRKRTTHY